MVNIRDLNKRIISVKKTQKITSALKLVAAAKFKKNQQTISSIRSYSERLNFFIATILQRNIDLNHVFFDVKEGKSLYVIVTTDRGLCGGFNQNVYKFINNLIEPGQDILVVGGKGISHYKRANFSVINNYRDLSEKINENSLQKLVDEIINLYLAEKYQKIFLVYNEFKSAVSQNIKIDEILPIRSSDFQIEVGANQADYDYEPSSERIIASMSKKYLYTRVYRALLESGTAEQGARMVAMDSATENAKDLIYDLTLSYNRVRQAAITTEIAEIVAGAEGLRTG